MKQTSSDKYFSQSYYLNNDELKKEYRSLGKKYHPDTGGSNEAMAAINEEYATLKKELLNNDLLNHVYNKSWSRPVASDPSKPELAQSEPVKSKPAKAKSAKPKPAKPVSPDAVWWVNEIVVSLKEWDIQYCINGGTIIAVKGKRSYEMKEELKKFGFLWSPLNEYWHWNKSHSKRKAS